MTSWIMPLSPAIYKVLKAFVELNGVIDQPASSGIHSGDFVFIYLSGKIRKILFKTIVIDEDISNENLINDRKYFVSDKAFKKFEKENTNTRYVRLKVVEYFDEDVNKKLTLEDIRANGYNGNFQQSIILDKKEQLFDYIKSRIT